jgi:hypothetical protein
MAFALGVMGERISRIVNVTIAYPPGPKSYWAFLCGKISEIKVRVESLPVTKEMLGDYLADGQYRHRFQLWLNELWWEKDQLLASLQAPVPMPAPVSAARTRRRDGEP